MTDLDRLLGVADTSFEQAIERLKSFMRFASVGTDSAFDGQTRACSEWVAEQLREIGLTAEVRETGGQPVVVAHDPAAPEDAPHLLYYGHYDVQPADPLDLWNTPPFEPSLADSPHGGKIVGRGAVDDKGQFMTILEALRIWRQVEGALPVRVSVIVEGEEENGSRNLPCFLQDHRDELAADICVISDTLMMDADRPAITVSMRGLVYVEVTVSGPTHDLHSGTFGGTVVNPAHVLTRMLAALHDDQGRVNVPGFYDDVEEPPEKLLAHWLEIGLDEVAFLRGAGVDRSTGEAGRALVERMWSRPCCDVNGIWSGYTGEGAKTIIPATASAKLSCRLVPGQSVSKVEAGLRDFLAARLPPDCRMDIRLLSSAEPVRVATDSVFVAAARRALERVYGVPAVLRGGAGSLPLIAQFREILGLDCLLMGFGLADDRVHSPNEKFELVCLRRGIRSHLAFLAEMATTR